MVHADTMHGFAGKFKEKMGRKNNRDRTAAGPAPEKSAIVNQKSKIKSLSAAHETNGTVVVPVVADDKAEVEVDNPRAGSPPFLKLVTLSGYRK